MKHSVRDEGVAGSNPATPTINLDFAQPLPDRYPDRYCRSGYVHAEAQPCQGWDRGFESHRPLQIFHICQRVLYGSQLPQCCSPASLALASFGNC